jgi:hypothetical protein
MIFVINVLYDMLYLGEDLGGIVILNGQQYTQKKFDQKMRMTILQLRNIQLFT